MRRRTDTWQVCAVLKMFLKGHAGNSLSCSRGLLPSLYQSSIILNAVFRFTPSVSVILSLSLSFTEPLLMHSWPLIKILYIVRKCICSGSGWRLSGRQEMSVWLAASSAIPRGRRLGQSASSVHLMEYGYFTPKLLATITAWREEGTGNACLCCEFGMCFERMCVCVHILIHVHVMGWWCVSISMCVRDRGEWERGGH